MVKMPLPTLRHATGKLCRWGFTKVQEPHVDAIQREGCIRLLTRILRVLPLEETGFSDTQLAQLVEIVSFDVDPSSLASLTASTVKEDNPDKPRKQKYAFSLIRVPLYLQLIILFTRL